LYKTIVVAVSGYKTVTPDVNCDNDKLFAGVKSGYNKVKLLGLTELK
jgi:hypothetical protein